jgi:hypothetical protein
MTTSSPATTSSATIEIIAREDEDLSRGPSDRVELISKKFPVGELREKFKEFMSSLQSIIEEDATSHGPFHLSEIQFSAEITGKGEFKLLGIGLGGQVSNAVTFTLTRKPSQ